MKHFNHLTPRIPDRLITSAVVLMIVTSQMLSACTIGSEEEELRATKHKAVDKIPQHTRVNGKLVDATLDLIAIGMSNIGISYVQPFPGTGSLSRSAVYNASGMRRPMGVFCTGVLAILALFFHTLYFSFSPKSDASSNH